MGIIRNDIAEPIANLIKRGQKELQEAERQHLAKEQQENRAKIDGLAARWKETISEIQKTLPLALALCIQSPSYEPNNHDKEIDQEIYYPVQLNLPGATPIRIWYHKGTFAYKAANWSLQIDESNNGKWFVGPTWGNWTWGKSAHEIRRLAGETTLAVEVANAAAAEEQRETLQAEADRLNYERRNPKPDPKWFEEPLAELALTRTRAGDHAAAQTYATLALAAEVRNLRRHFDDEAETKSLFTPAPHHYDHIPDSELPEIPL